MKHSWVVLPVLCFGLYWNSRDNGFHYDDIHSIVDNIHIRQLANIPSFLVEPSMFSVDADKAMYRPTLLVTYAINYAAGEATDPRDLRGGGLDGFTYHLGNILIHGLNACLVWWLARLIGGCHGPALVAGLLFLAHPLCAEPVNYISARSDSLAALFYLMGLCLFIGVAARGEEVWRRCSWLAAFALGLLCKSTVITLPLVVLLYDYLHLRDSRRSFGRRVVVTHVPAWVIAALYLVTISRNGFLSGSLANPVRDGWTQALTQIKAVSYYLHNLVVPTHLVVEPQFSEQTTFWSGVVVLSVCLALSVGLILYYLWIKKSRTSLFILLWPLISMLPVVVMPLNVFVNERRLYLPCAAFCIGLALVLSSRGLSQLKVSGFRGRTIAAAALGIVFAAIVFDRNKVWSSDFTLWQDAVAKAPKMPRNHLYLGNAYKDLAQSTAAVAAARPHWQAASQSYRRVIELGSDEELSVRSQNNLGSVQFMLGNFEAAEKAYRAALASNPSYVDAIINMGSIILMKARGAKDDAKGAKLLRESIKYFKQALESRPNNDDAWGNVGVAYHDLGDIDEALKAYEKSLHLNPQNARAWRNRGSIYHLMADEAIASGGTPVEELKKARYSFRKAVRFRPSYTEALLGLKQVEEKLQRIAEK